VKNPSSAVVVAAAILLLAGCGSSSGSTSGDSSKSSSSAGSSGSSPSAASTSSAAASPTGPAPCRTSGLKVTLGPGEGAAGSTFFPLMIKNVSTKPCRTGGFGGVSLVSKPNGTPIGAPADRTQQGSVKPIVLHQGQVATATIQLTNAENFPAAKCQPKQATGFRVYPPNETHSAFVAHRSPACASAKVHLLTLRPYRAG
jgi:uncharacterized protein DUF4232